MRRKVLALVFSIVIALAYAACDTSDNTTNKDKNTDKKSSRAYKGHENDVDIDNLCKVYPDIIGSRLDDCQTCHTGEKDIAGVLVGNACDYCHNLMLTSSKAVFADTLNSYGTDYMNGGRSKAAIKDIRDTDSDGDGFTNNEEIKKYRYPGYSFSKPGQPNAPKMLVGVSELKAMPAHSEFLLANTKKQQFDFYANYEGVKFLDIFTALGIDMTGATGITIIAPDGFMKSYTIAELSALFPQPIFYSGLDVASLGAECGFVEYPAVIPGGVADTQPIPGQHYLLLAHKRDGAAMESSYLDVDNGTIEGEGPYRLIVPQTTPGSPDRGMSYATTCGDVYEYDGTKDHNAGSMVRGVIAIRIDPMPAGYEEFDYVNGGWAFIDTKQIIIYGNNVNP